jgi:hypothetical protein
VLGRLTGFRGAGEAHQAGPVVQVVGVLSGSSRALRKGLLRGFPLYF